MKKYINFSLIGFMLIIGCTNNTILIFDSDPTDDPNPAIWTNNLYHSALQGEVSVVVFMVNAENSPHPLASNLEIENKYALGAYNARDYFIESSFGAFIPVLDAVVGPYTIPSGVTEHDTVLLTLTQAEADGFNFARFDRNGDGVLRQNEVIFAFADSISMDGGAVRYRGGTLPSGMRYDMPVVHHGSYANLGTIAHEISHILGTHDLYGSNCNSYRETLLSCTITGNYYNDTINLDPWHRVNLGWINPRFIRFDPEHRAKRCFILSVTNSWEYSTNLETYRPLLVFEDHTGPQEYFLIEYRRPSLYDNINHAGIGLWSIRVDSFGSPYVIPGLHEGRDMTIWAYESPRSRGGVFWRTPVNPTYQDDTNAGWTITVENPISNNTDHVLVCLNPV